MACAWRCCRNPVPLVAVVALLLSSLWAPAGVELDLRLEYGEYLQYEPVRAYVSVYNDSDTPLVIRNREGRGLARLDLIVRRTQNDLMQRTSDRPVHAGSVLEPDGRTELMLEVSELYDIVGNGRYFVKATLEHGGRKYETPIRIITVVPGMELARKSKSVPGNPDRIRSYSLRYWAREGRGYLFLRVDEEETRLNYGVFQLGPLVRVSTPVLEVSRAGEVVVSHQCSRGCYMRTVLKSLAGGVTLVDQTYHLPNGDPYPFVRPKLHKPR